MSVYEDFRAAIRNEALVVALGISSDISTLSDLHADAQALITSSMDRLDALHTLLSEQKVALNTQELAQAHTAVSGAASGAGVFIFTALNNMERTLRLITAMQNVSKFEAILKAQIAEKDVMGAGMTVLNTRRSLTTMGKSLQDLHPEVVESFIEFLRGRIGVLSQNDLLTTLFTDEFLFLLLVRPADATALETSILEYVFAEKQCLESTPSSHTSISDNVTVFSHFVQLAATNINLLLKACSSILHAHGSLYLTHSADAHAPDTSDFKGTVAVDEDSGFSFQRPFSRLIENLLCPGISVTLQQVQLFIRSMLVSCGFSLVSAETPSRSDTRYVLFENGEENTFTAVEIDLLSSSFHTLNNLLTRFLNITDKAVRQAMKSIRLSMESTLRDSRKEVFLREAEGTFTSLGFYTLAKTDLIGTIIMTLQETLSVLDREYLRASFSSIMESSAASVQPEELFMAFKRIYQRVGVVECLSTQPPENDQSAWRAGEEFRSALRAELCVVAAQLMIRLNYDCVRSAYFGGFCIRELHSMFSKNKRELSEMTSFDFEAVEGNLHDLFIKCLSQLVDALLDSLSEQLRSLYVHYDATTLCNAITNMFGDTAITSGSAKSPTDYLLNALGVDVNLSESQRADLNSIAVRPYFERFIITLSATVCTTVIERMMLYTSFAENTAVELARAVTQLTVSIGSLLHRPIRSEFLWIRQVCEILSCMSASEIESLRASAGWCVSEGDTASIRNWMGIV